MGDAEQRRAPHYSAFISYSHADAVAALRLQRRIEHYRLPRAIRGGRSARLRPAFRDRDELGAAPDLSAAVRRAIRRSEHLIVVCTPHAARSDWVGREIAYFRLVHGDRRILAALFAGDEDAAFHPALLTARNGSPVRPLAADFRGGGDGWLAFLKLVAALAHVGLDDLVRRDARRRRARRLLAFAAAAALGAAAAVLMLTAAAARRRSAEEEARTTGAVGFQLTELRRTLAAAGRLDLLAAVNEGVARTYAGRDLATLGPEAKAQRAALFQAEAEDDEQRGRLVAARREVLEAYRITAPLLASRPGDSRALYAHAQSEYWVGFTDWRMGRPDHAEGSFRRYARLANRLVTLEPGKAEWRAEQGYAYSNLGTLVLRERRNTAAARAAFAIAQAAFEAVARARPGEMGALYDLADGEAWLATTAGVDGHDASALAHRLRERAILEAMLARAPRDARYRGALSANAIGLARLAAAGGDFAGALERLDEAKRVAEALAAADPESAAAARRVRAVDLFRAQMWLAMPAATRPPSAVIAAAIGDCGAEWRKPGSDEVAAICTLTAARAAAGKGDGVGARSLLAGLDGKPVMQEGKLSERWLLDLQGMRTAIVSSFSSVPVSTGEAMRGPSPR